jgi:hypothetical protein
VEEPLARPRAAYQRLSAEIDAVPDESLVLITLDIATCVATAHGVLPEVRTFDAEIRQLPNFDVANYEKLEDYALALKHADTLYVAASMPPEDLAVLLDRAVKARELLLSNIQTFIVHDLIPERREGELDRTLGHRGLVNDVERFAEIVRESWPKVQGKTPLTRAQLDEFETLSDRLLTALGLKAQSEEVVAESTLRRQRAFALFLRAYNEVRRAVSFLRWNHGDVDSIIPSLYSVKGGRKKGGTEPEVVAPSPPATAPTNPVTPAPNSVEVPIGLPGSSPFMK